MITTVTNAAALNTALASAHAGDINLLASGNYGAVYINNLHFAQDVTIASADPLAQAVLTGLQVQSGSGLAFQNLELNAIADNGNFHFTVYSSSDVHFSGLHLHGSMDGDPQNDVGGMLVRDSSDVSITGSDFQQLGTAL